MWWWPPGRFIGHRWGVTRHASLAVVLLGLLLILVLVVMPYLGYDVVRFFHNINGVA